MKKDKFQSKLAFYISLGFWVPLFNIGFAVVALFIGFSALRNVIKDPDTYAGLPFAVIAIILSVSSLVLTAIGLVLYLFSPEICGSAICTELLSQ